MSTPIKLAGITVALLAVTPFSGCRSVESRIADQRGVVDTRYLEQVAMLENLEPQALDWDAAHARMLAENLELRRARERILNAEENIERIFLDLLPTVNLGASLTRGLTDLSNLQEEDFSFNVFALVNIPGVVSLRTRYYAATLELIRARWALELDERQKTIQLYETFVRFENLRQRKRNLERTLAWRRIDASPTRLTADPEVIEREALLFNIEREANQMQLAIGRLINDFSFLWELDASSIPAFSYETEPLDLTDLETTGGLLRRLQAVELEGARLREQGIKLQYWPDLNATLSAPPVFAVANGESRTFSTDDILVNFRSSVALDTRLRTTYQLRDARRQTALLKEALALETVENIERLRTAQKQLELLDKQLQLIDLRLDAQSSAPRGGDLRDIRDQLQAVILLSERRAALEQQKATLEGLFWLVDERRWTIPSPTPEGADAG